MELKDIGLIIIAFLGWSWGIIQFFINSRNQKKDKLIDRRYEAYSAYMKKSDELMNNVRNDPNIIYGIPTDIMKTIFSGDEEQINSALIQFNEKLLDFVKKASEPLMILKQELNSLLIICSDELSSNIEELILLMTDFNNEVQKSLNMISPNGSNSEIMKIQTLCHNERQYRIETINKEIIRQMRKELGNK